MSQDPLQSLFVIGCSHHRTPLRVRERLALDQVALDTLRNDLRNIDGMCECLVLDTCNRLEIYGLVRSPAAVEKIEPFLCSRRRIETFRKYAFRYHGFAALRHVFQVASGLDSQIVGETEILGQMKNAYARAKDDQSTGPILNRLFQKSFQAAKAARTRTGIAKGRASIGNIVLRLADRIFDRLLRNGRVLLLGSGDMGQAAALALKNRDVANITVSSRAFENARRIARQLGETAIDFADFPDQLHRFDIIIAATAATNPILTRSMVEKALRHRPDRPLFLIDLAVPRNISPCLHRLENVHLYDLDDLSDIANRNIRQRESEIRKAENILEAEAWKLWLRLRIHSKPFPVSSVPGLKSQI